MGPPPGAGPPSDQTAMAAAAMGLENAKSGTLVGGPVRAPRAGPAPTLMPAFFPKSPPTKDICASVQEGQAGHPMPSERKNNNHSPV